MNFCCLIVFGVLISTNIAFHIPDECIVKREWRKEILWQEFHIGVWTQKNQSDVIEVIVDFHNYDEYLYTDEFTVSRNSYSFTENRNFDLNITTYKTSKEIQDGWNKFILQINGEYIIWYINSPEETPIIRHKIKLEPRSLKVIGSNVTLNCPTDTRVWKVTRYHEAVLPLDSSRVHNISVYSNGRTNPSIKLGNRNIPLRWSGHLVTTVDTEPLPPYVQYNLSLTCESSYTTTCTIKIDDNVELDSIKLNKIPDIISFKKQNESDYFVILHNPRLKESQLNSTAAIPTYEYTHNEKENGDSGTIAVLIALLLIFVVISIILGAAIFYIRKIKTQRTNEDGEAGCPQKEPLINQPRENQVYEIDGQKEMNISLTKPINYEEYDELTYAVMQNDLHLVRYLLPKSKEKSLNIERAFIEANLLGISAIIKEFESVINIDKESAIKEVQKEYDRRVNKIFHAANNGRYQHGVTLLLQQYSLPPTVRNEHGRSILHIVASSKNENGGPKWTAENVQKFLNEQIIYPNAIDYGGKTCLHLLCEAAVESPADITWNGKIMSIKSAWVELAKLLVSHGCDPSLKDDQGNRPHDISQEKRSELRRIFEEVSPPKFEKKISFIDLMKRAKSGTPESLSKAMMQHPDLLLLWSIDNPLTVAVTRGRLEATLILLSGGASVCGHSHLDITPFEASHNVENLPGIFPALIRRECCNQLMFEKKKDKNEKCEKLDAYIKARIDDINNGKMREDLELSSDPNHEVNRKARELLCLAAEWGLSLTCQMLSLDNFNLHPLPDEDKPVVKALQNKNQEKVITVLYRDLLMSPFSRAKIENISQEFLNKVWNAEYEYIEKNCETKKDTNLHKECMDLIIKAHNGEKVHMTEKRIFSFIARHGLDYIFHILKKNMTPSKTNQVVDDLTECTMLHIAAMYGRFNMVDYLVYNDANIMAKAKGGFTAAHFAAIKGHRGCMEYLLFYMREDNLVHDPQSNEGHTPTNFLDAYNQLLKEAHLLVSPESIGLEILSIPSLSRRTKILLEKKCEELNIDNREKLLDFVKQSNEKDNTSNHILENMKSLLKGVSETDARFIGDIATYHTNSHGLNIPLESMQIYWEVKSSQFNDFTVSTTENKPPSLSVSFHSEKDNFMGSFFEAVKKTMDTFNFNPSYTYPLYPSVRKDVIGVSMLLQVYINGCLHLLSVLLVPVLKTNYLEENRKHFENPIFEQKELIMYLANSTDDKWTYVTTKIEDDIISSLKEEQQLVLKACKLLTRILYSCWWYPKREKKRHIKTWKACSIKLQTLPDRVLASLFFEEINLTTDDDWSESKLLDRMIAIFKRAVSEESSGDGKQVMLFFDNQNFFKCNKLVDQIVHFLEELAR